MFTNPLASPNQIMNKENSIKPIQGPCGNSTYQLLSTTNDYDGIITIPHINDEQLIIEERYSIIDGCFGTVKINNFFHLFYKFNIDCSRLYLSSSSI